MATAEAAIVAVLQADATVAALIGTRIYPEVLPQGVTYPAVRYARISTARSPYRRLQQGTSTRARPRFQIDGWALSKGEALALAEAVRLALDGYQGTEGGLKIDAAALEDEGSDFEEGIGPGGAGVYRVRMDFFLSYPE